MALLFWDSFDCTTSGAIMLARYDTGSAGPWNIVAGRTGNAAYMTYSKFLTPALSTSGAAIVGVALNVSGGSTNQIVVGLWEGSTLHLALETDSTGKLYVVRGDGTVLATSSTALVLSSWYYVEFKATIHDSTGTYDVRVDGSTFGGLSASGVDTRNGGSGTWDRVSLGNAGGNQAFAVDDFYVCDASGSLNNDFLGNIKITVVLPQTDAVGGTPSHQDYVCSTGSDHGALVDEASPNDDTDYLSSSVVGDIQTFNYPACGVTTTILGVGVVPYLKKTDAGSRTCKTVARVSGTDYVHSADIIVKTSYGHAPQVWEHNPNTSAAWTAGGIDGAEFGIKTAS